MMPNTNLAASQPPFPAEYKKPARAVPGNGGPALLPVRRAAASAPKLRLQQVSLSYQTDTGSELVALDGIDLNVRAGEFLCIVGPSGCGKSTLLHLIAAMQKPSSGVISIDDQEVRTPGTDRILIFQEHGLFPWLTVGQNVAFGMKMKGLSKAEREEKTRHYLRLVHLSQFKDSRPHQLSGGMRQRVALARALATEPDVLLMDEPFAALDAQTRDMLHDELEKIWAETGCTIVFVTHNVREAVRLGDRVALMSFRPGRVKQEFVVDLPRPRHLEEVEVARTAREILDSLRDEINKSLEAEYAHDRR